MHIDIVIRLIFTSSSIQKFAQVGTQIKRWIRGGLPMMFCKTAMFKYRMKRGSCSFFEMGSQQIHQSSWLKKMIKAHSVVWKRAEIKTRTLQQTADLEEMADQVRLVLNTMMRNNGIIFLRNLAIAASRQYIINMRHTAWISPWNLASSLHQLSMRKVIRIVQSFGGTR